MGEAKINKAIRDKKAEFRKQLPMKIFRGIVNVFATIPVLLLFFFMAGYRGNKWAWGVLDEQ